MSPVLPTVGGGKLFFEVVAFHDAGGEFYAAERVLLFRVLGIGGNIGSIHEDSEAFLRVQKISTRCGLCELTLRHSHETANRGEQINLPPDPFDILPLQALVIDEQSHPIPVFNPLLLCGRELRNRFAGKFVNTAVISKKNDQGVLEQSFGIECRQKGAYAFVRITHALQGDSAWEDRGRSSPSYFNNISGL